MKQNSKKKALVPALAMALASIIALSGVTYAWFTAGNTSTVEAMDLEVVAADGIMVSLDAATWKSTITKDDRDASIAGQDASSNYAYKTNTNQFPTDAINPISTAGDMKATATDQLALFSGKYEENPSTLEYDLTTTAIAAETNDAQYGKDYIAFDLFFDVTSDTTVRLDGNSAVAAVAGQQDNRSYLASRVAFIDMGAQQTAQEARDDKSPEEAAIIWEPNATLHTPKALELGATAGINTYEGVSKAGVNDVTDGITETKTSANDVLINLQTGFNKVRIYVWLEGQDADCNNDISGGFFSTKLVFAK